MKVAETPLVRLVGDAQLGEAWPVYPSVNPEGVVKVGIAEPEMEVKAGFEPQLNRRFPGVPLTGAGSEVVTEVQVDVRVAGVADGKVNVC